MITFIGIKNVLDSKSNIEYTVKTGKRSSSGEEVTTLKIKKAGDDSKVTTDLNFFVCSERGEEVFYIDTNCNDGSINGVWNHSVNNRRYDFNGSEAFNFLLKRFSI